MSKLCNIVPPNKTPINALRSQRGSDAEEIFDCQCLDLDHLVRFLYSAAYSQKDAHGNDYYEEQHLYIDVVMSAWEGFWKRLRTSVSLLSRYFKSNCGLFQSVVFQVEDLPRLMNLLSRFTTETSEIAKEPGSKVAEVCVEENPYRLLCCIDFGRCSDESNDYIIDLYVHVDPVPYLSFWDRLEVAYYYLVHKGTRRGHSWEFELRENDVRRLRGLVERMQELFKTEIKDASSQCLG